MLIYSDSADNEKCSICCRMLSPMQDYEKFGKGHLCKPCTDRGKKWSLGI